MHYSSHDLNDTIVALATPPGIGAIGVIRLSGKEALPIADGVFKGKNLLEQLSHTIHFGSIQKEDGSIIDEVLVSLFIAPTSYTGENVVEVSCHGSNYIIQQLIQLFIAKGARMAQPGEFTLRAFLNGRMDLSQAEAVADLIASNTESAHQLAIQQMRGGFSNEIQQLRQQLIDFASLVELELDFAEEDVEFADRDNLRDLIKKIQKISQALISSFSLGNAIKNGVNTVIAGRPNAGKSTLLNALLNEERAIVSEIAGTTRDTIEEVLNIQGIPFRLIDTAGIREARDQIEAIGVQKTMEKIGQSSLLVYVFDVIQSPPEEVQADLEKLLQPNVHLLVVANKMDLNPYTKLAHYQGVVESGEWRVVSEGQVTGSGKQETVVSGQESGVSGEGGENRGQKSDDRGQMKVREEEQGAGSGEQGQKEGTQEPSDFTEPFQTTSNHIELPTPQSIGSQPIITSSNWVPVSAINQMNIEYLKEKLYEAVITEKVQLESTIVSNVRHYEALKKAHESLDDVLKGMDDGITSDFIAMDIRRALAYLGEITGEISTDDLLGNIFGKFCIGK